MVMQGGMVANVPLVEVRIVVLPTVVYWRQAMAK